MKRAYLLPDVGSIGLSFSAGPRAFARRRGFPFRAHRLRSRQVGLKTAPERPRSWKGASPSFRCLNSRRNRKQRPKDRQTTERTRDAICSRNRLQKAKMRAFFCAASRLKRGNGRRRRCRFAQVHVSFPRVVVSSSSGLFERGEGLAPFYSRGRLGVVCPTRRPRSR